ncbi:hypothetical protein [Raoultella terrigena]|uniref:hypothetical protein n=1 Tax=Raoultella terrigena TaxID=577 RepID=UPI0013E2F22A|nr:hypothetical protein [Raoultella terrigena]
MPGNDEGRIGAWWYLAVQFDKTNVFVLHGDSAKVGTEGINAGLKEGNDADL